VCASAYLVCTGFRIRTHRKDDQHMDVISGAQELGIGAGWKRDECLPTGLLPGDQEGLAISADHLE